MCAQAPHRAEEARDGLPPHHRGLVRDRNDGEADLQEKARANGCRRQKDPAPPFALLFDMYIYINIYPARLNTLAVRTGTAGREGRSSSSSSFGETGSLETRMRL